MAPIHPFSGGHKYRKTETSKSPAKSPPKTVVRDYKYPLEKDVSERIHIEDVDLETAAPKERKFLSDEKFYEEIEKWHKELATEERKNEGACDLLCYPVINVLTLLVGFCSLFVMFLYFYHEEKVHGYPNNPRGARLYIPRLLFFYELIGKMRLGDITPALCVFPCALVVFVFAMAAHYSGRHQDGFRTELILIWLDAAALLDIALSPVDASHFSRGPTLVLVFVPLAVGAFVGMIFSTIVHVGADYVITGRYCWHGYSDEEFRKLAEDDEEKVTDEKMHPPQTHGLRPGLNRGRTVCQIIWALVLLFNVGYVFCKTFGFQGELLTGASEEEFVEHLIQGTKGGPVPFPYSA